MMKKILVVILAVAMVGCAATKEEMDAYYQSIHESNQIIADSIAEQSIANRAAKAAQMIHFSDAMSRAAATESKTDDVIVSFAWGYQSGQPLGIEIPKLKTPAAPVTDVDRVKAWTPMVGMFTPLLTPLIYGATWGSSSGASTIYQLTDQAQVSVGSQNSGSLNSNTGGSQTVGTSTVTSSQDDLILSGSGTLNGVNPTTAETTKVDVSQPTACGGLGYQSGDGSWWISPGCSCDTHYAGGC